MEATGLTNTSPKAQPADPKQQAQFDLILGRCRQIMGESAQEWLDTLQKAPVDGAVTLGTTTLRQIAQMSEKAGQPVDPVVLIHAGIQLCKDIAGVANAAGLVPDDQLPQYLQDTMSQSMMQYLKDDADDGLLSPQDKQRGQEIVDQAGPGMQAATQPPMQPAPAPEEQPGMLAQMQRKGGV